MGTRWIKTWVTVSTLTVSGVHGETLYQRDGITLEGTVRIEDREAGVCRVSADQHAADVYERMKANDGQPLHVWRLVFGVRNGSGRRVESLTAHFGIASEAPPCTSWSGPAGNYAKPVQWANSFQVLQQPNGMGLGEEVNDTVFVLAFHDQQPKFESWNVDYRFVDDPGSEAERARGTPAFIVVTVPAHATVSLLNAAQPYRRRMPLEPGRYQVEVSAPGYRTHRAWVDHKRTWPHRIELERLAGGDGSSVPSVLGAAPASRLPPEVQVDLNLRKAEHALQEGDAATARDAMERLVSLQQEHGLEPAAEDHFRYARAWEAAGEPERAMEAAVRYLQLRERQAEHYTEALDLLNRAESAQIGLSSEVSEASRVLPKVPQREASHRADGLEPAIAGTAQEEPARVPPPEIVAVRNLRIAQLAIQDQDLKTARLTIERLQQLADEHELGAAIETAVRQVQQWLREAESLEKPRTQIASDNSGELGGPSRGEFKETSDGLSAGGLNVRNEIVGGAALPSDGTDLRGQVVCGVPPSQAAVLAVETGAGKWHGFALRGIVKLGMSDSDPERALGNWADSATYVCDVEARVNFRTYRAKFYTLPYKLQRGGRTPGGDVLASDFDVRKLIVGESSSRDKLTGFVVQPDTDMPIWIEATPGPRPDVTYLWWTLSGGYPVVFGYGPEGHAACEAIASREGLKSKCSGRSDLNGYLNSTWPCAGYAISRRPDGSFGVNTFYGVADERSPDDVRRSQEGREALDRGDQLVVICLNP